jgi:ATP-dependent DNA helicase RecQ
VALHGRADDALHTGFVDRSRPTPRGLRQVHAAVRQQIPAGGKGVLDLRALVAHLGRGWSDEAAEAAVMALAAAGAVRILPDGGSPGKPEGALPIGVLGGVPDLTRAATLRRAALAKHAEVRRYARTRGCRRRVLLAYFGELDAPERCGKCDRCLGNDDPLAGELGRACGLREAFRSARALLGRPGSG